MAGFERDSIRADQVPKIHTPAGAGALVKGEVRLLAGAEEIVEDAEPIMVGEGPCPGIQAAEALGEVAVYPAEIGPRLLDLPLGDGEGDVLLLDQVVALLRPPGHDLVGLPAVFVQAVPFLFQEDRALEVYWGQAAVEDGDLGGGVGGQGVEDAAVGEEDGALFLLGGGGIVDIGKAPGAAVLPSHLPDAVAVYPPNGDGLLDAPGDQKAVTLALVGGQEGFNQSLGPLSGAGGHSRSSRRQRGGLRQREAPT